MVYGAYAVLALWVTARIWAHVGTRTPAVNPSDHQVALWFLAHAARVVTEGADPLYSHQLNVPDGVNLMANTSMLGLGIPMAPVTLLFGPHVSFAALIWLSFAGTSAAYYLLLRRTLSIGRVGAAIGAGLCGFAPGLISHASGQLNWAAQFVVPLILLAVVGLAKPGRGPLRIALLVFLVVYQVFINEEILLLTAFACGVFFGSYALLCKDRIRPVFRMFVIRMAIAAGVAAVVLAYPLYHQFFGPGHYRGLPFAPNDYPADLWSYFALAGESMLGSPEGATRYASSATEENAFFGLGLMLLASVIAWRLWSKAVVKAAVITGGVSLALSLGDNIRVAGRVTGIPGPFIVLEAIPLGEMLVPSRLALIVVPVIGLLLALGWDRIAVLDKASRLPWTVAFAGALLPIVPTPIKVAELAAAPAFVTGGVWREYVPEGRTAVVVPLPTPHMMTGQTWSAVTRTGIALPGGYFIGPTGRNDPAGLWGPLPRPSMQVLNDVAWTGQVPSAGVLGRDQLIADLGHWRAAVVLLDVRARHAGSVKQVLDGLLGAATERDGVWLWDVRGLMTATP